jgi:hypothetical protein
MRRLNPGAHGPIHWFLRTYTERDSVVRIRATPCSTKGPVWLPLQVHGQTIDELSDALLPSRSAITGAVELLESYRMVRRMTAKLVASTNE